MTHTLRLFPLLACAVIAFGIVPVRAANDLVLTIKDHKFSPETLEVPAGQKLKIRVVNQDPTPEEFESYELNREKIIAGNSEAIIFINPLKAGTYPFFGEFNMDTAKGQIVAK